MWFSLAVCGGDDTAMIKATWGWSHTMVRSGFFPRTVRISKMLFLLFVRVQLAVAADWARFLLKAKDIQEGSELSARAASTGSFNGSTAQLLPDCWASFCVSNNVPRHPAEKNHFSCFYLGFFPWSYCKASSSLYHSSRAPQDQDLTGRELVTTLNMATSGSITLCTKMQISY